MEELTYRNRFTLSYTAPYYMLEVTVKLSQKNWLMYLEILQMKVREQNHDKVMPHTLQTHITNSVDWISHPHLSLIWQCSPHGIVEAQQHPAS